MDSLRNFSFKNLRGLSQPAAGPGKSFFDHLIEGPGQFYGILAWNRQTGAPCFFCGPKNGFGKLRGEKKGRERLLRGREGFGSHEDAYDLVQRGSVGCEDVNQQPRLQPRRPVPHEDNVGRFVG